MLKLFFVVWLIVAPTLMGSFVLIVLIVPSLAQNTMELILPAALAGAVAGLPFSYWIAAKMMNLTKK